MSIKSSFFQIPETQFWPNNYSIRPLMPRSLSLFHVSYRLQGSCSCAGGFRLQRFSEERADWIWFSLGLHVFGVTSFPHLARFSGHNFPLCWPPYWWLGFLRRSRVKLGGQLSVHSPLQCPAWLTCSERAFLPFTREQKCSAVTPQQDAYRNKQELRQRRTQDKQVRCTDGTFRAHEQARHTRIMLMDRRSPRQWKLTLLVWRGPKRSMGDNYFKWSQRRTETVLRLCTRGVLSDWVQWISLVL